MSKVQPIAKAVAPAVLTLLASVASGMISGHFDARTITIAATGLIGSLVSYLVPNSRPVTSPPVTPAPVASLQPELAPLTEKKAA